MYRSRDCQVFFSVSADVNGIFRLEDLAPVLSQSGQSIDAQELIDRAESQGLLVRLDLNRWQILE